MLSYFRRTGWRWLSALFLAANLAGWCWLYAQFLRYFFLDPNPFRLSLSLLQWLPAVAAAVFILPRIRPRESPLRRGWFFLALALLLWFLADFLEYLPSGSWLAATIPISRMVHLLGFSCALAAAFFFAPVPAGRFGRLRFLLDMLIHGASWGVLLWFLTVEPILRPVESPTSQWFWPAAYAIADLILWMLILWSQGQHRKPPRNLWLLAGGFFLLSVYDMVSGWMAGQGAVQAHIWTGFLMLGGYGLMTAAAAIPDSPRTADESEPAAALPTPWQRLRERWRTVEARWLPLASTLALVFFLFAQWRQTETLDPVLVVCTISVSLLLFLREGVIAGQAEAAGYAVLLENLEDPAFICTGGGTVLLENTSCRKLLPPGKTGGRLGEILNVRPAWDFLLREADLAGWQGEIWVESAGRGGFPAWLVLQRLPHEEGRPDNFAGLLHDLSPQRRQEESLRAAYRQAEDSRLALEELSGKLEDKVAEKTADLSRALDQLEEQNRQLRSLDRLKSDFIALTSHELRTPLTGIRAGVELMLVRKPSLPKDACANLRLVQRESERLARFVENILDLSALDAGRMPLQAVPLRIGEVLEAARMALAAAHGGSESRNLRRLEISVAEDLPEVLADEHVLSSVLFQLIDNAFKYAPEGPVLVTAGAGAECVELTIADRGPGVAPEQRERLFLMFSRLEDADSPRAGGVGLGLHISRKMVEAMGGSLDLLPAGQGMTLRLRLPVFIEVP
jgi:signal transduction histidine kinase